MNKKGVVPIVATVILIAIAFTLAGIIFLWAQSFIVALGPVGLSCEDVNFEAGVFCEAGSEDCFLDILNRGNVELHGFEIKEFGPGSILVRGTVEESIDIGGSSSIKLNENYETGTKILIVPVVLEETVGSEEFFTCEDKFGVEFVV